MYIYARPDQAKEEQEAFKAPKTQHCTTPPPSASPRNVASIANKKISSLLKLACELTSSKA